MVAVLMYVNCIVMVPGNTNSYSIAGKKRLLKNRNVRNMSTEWGGSIEEMRTPKTLYL
ncbi:hypothetical protein KDA_36390 [Dictyobacter alpinus]|uniref:Uncharacterized protein n=1 Tax=Dictyobacter alpinus TaxID=2014873 RepID=A0A402B9X5_9CHLR|nr:hypothetical protein KDA_36390 [Dictyobacter alpinus]